MAISQKIIANIKPYRFSSVLRFKYKVFELGDLILSKVQFINLELLIMRLWKKPRCLVFLGLPVKSQENYPRPRLEKSCQRSQEAHA
ncbi:hypothetical protein NIES4073_02780 (plasmid) [Kalymmatonema gypsitolerans NIES-4073]|nr:hypothetical protein NIES4073_02780 [Scytonema sp. NIES-4073]